VATLFAERATTKSLRSTIKELDQHAKHFIDFTVHVQQQQQHQHTHTYTYSSFLLGQLSNDAISRLLKEFVASSEVVRAWLGDLVNRPVNSDRDECGVPSNHAQSVAFFSLFASYILMKEVRVNIALARWVRYLLVFALIVLMVLVATSRVYLEYHTPEQVSIGIALGLAFAFLWIQLHRLVIHRGFVRIFGNIGSSYFEALPIHLKRS